MGSIDCSSKQNEPVFPVGSVMETCDKVPPSVGAVDGSVVVGRIEEMAEDEGFEWSKLREELQERILARLPFVKYFQVPLLSKGWRIISRSQVFHDEVTSVSHRWPVFCPVLLSRKGLVGYDAAAQRWQKLFTLSYLPYVPHGDDVVSLCSGAGSLICFARRSPTKEKEMFRHKQKSLPVSAELYSRLMQAREGERRVQGSHWQGQLPPWHSSSEGFLTRIQNFQRRLQQFCMADTGDDELSEEAQVFNAYIDLSLRQPYPDNLGVGKAFDIYVTNVVTKKWRALPSRPYMERPDIVQVVAVGTSAYKVILMTLLQQRSLDSFEGPFCVQIYDSRTDSWTLLDSPATISSLGFSFVKACVYLESKGVFCIILQDSDLVKKSYEILAYNVELNCWTRIPHPLAFSNHEFLICELVICGSTVMLITGRKDTDGVAKTNPLLVAMGYTGRERMLIYRLDIDSMSFDLFSRGPPPGRFRGIIVDLMVGAGDCVYFGLRSEPSNPFLVFNIRQKSWSQFSPADKSWLCLISRTTKFPFQPGLNPYLNLGTGRGGPAADAVGLGGSAAHTAELGDSANPRTSTAMEDLD